LATAFFESCMNLPAGEASGLLLLTETACGYSMILPVPKWQAPISGH